MPATGYLEIVWKVLAEMNLKSIEEVPVIFENVKITREVVLSKNENITFLVNIMSSSGNFEVSESQGLICSGKVTIPEDIASHFTNIEVTIPKQKETLPMQHADVYKLFHLKRYLYNGNFKGIYEADASGTYGILKWCEQITAFLNTMCQITLLNEHSCDLKLLRYIKKVVIDPINHMGHCDENRSIPVKVDKYLNVIKSGSIEISGIEYNIVAKQQNIHGEPNLESYSFTPYDTISNNETDLEVGILHAIQIVLENNNGRKLLKVMNAIPERADGKFSKLVERSVKREPQTRVTFSKIEESSNVDLAIFIENCMQPIDNKVLSKLREGGFVLYQGSKYLVANFGLTPVFETTYNDRGVFLLRRRRRRRKNNNANTRTVIKVDNNNFTWLEELKSLVRTSEKEVIYLYSQHEDISGIMGLVKCLLWEDYEEKSFKCVLIQDKDVEPFSLSSSFFKKQLDKDLTFNVYSRSAWGSYRYTPLHQIQNTDVQHASSLIHSIGDLSSFRWEQRPKEYFKYTPKSEVAHVFYSGLNSRDVSVAIGRTSKTPSRNPTSPESGIGVEFSGITENGRRVMGIVPEMGISLQVAIDPLFTWDVPSNWSLEDAATVPWAYATCYYALIIRGQLEHGESILIHAGSVGVGLAAISIALSMDCEVFTTCATQDKRDILKKIFPKLRNENIGNFRDNMFERIKYNTKGKGVDLILNSFASDQFEDSLRCIAEGGRFLEIEKEDLIAGRTIDTKIFLKNCSFHGVLMENLLESDCKQKEDIKRLLEDGIIKGVVRPLPRRVFDETEVEGAYRFVSTGKHKGNVLIKIRNDDSTNVKQPARSICALPRIFFDSDKSYVIIGGLGGFGLELTQFLIRRNAKRIILNSTRGVSTGYQAYCIKRWLDIEGVVVRTNTDNSSTTQGTERLLKAALELGPVGGIFNCALRLLDALVESQTQITFQTSLAPKAESLSKLDLVSRCLCPKLDHFVALSSVVCGRGNAGQTNYGMANSIMERICEKRRNDGLPALAIQYGIIGDVGIVAEQAGNKKLSVDGFSPQSINSCLESLEKFMLQSNPIVASHLLKEMADTVNSASVQQTPTEIIARILGIKDIEHIDKRQTLTQLGLDSLMVTEIKQMYRSFNIQLKTDDIRELTFEKIAEIAIADTRKNNEDPKTNVQDGIGCSLKTIDAVLPKDIPMETEKLRNFNIRKVV